MSTHVEHDQRGNDTVVRAAFAAATVPGVDAPWNTIHLKVHYPAVFSGDDAERLSGDVAVDPAVTPLPVVVFLNGINVGPEAYGWLARRLAASGRAVVTFSWVSELFPGQYGITCGLDMAAVTPDTYGTRASANAVGPILDALARMHAGSGPLAGALDLDRVALGGHSAGATITYENASPRFVPGLACAFGFGGHTMASTMLGWPPDTLLDIPGDVPLLVLGGTRDGVMAGSSDRYGQDGHTTDPVVRTFTDAIPESSAPAYLALVEGANHFAIGHPHDPSSARGFLDMEPVGDPADHRHVIAGLVDAFLVRHLDGRDDDHLDTLLAGPSLAVSRVRGDDPGGG
jgi:dienelactone hydrolase